MLTIRSLTGEEDVSAVQRRVLIPHLHNSEPQVLEGFTDSINLGEERAGRDILTPYFLPTPDIQSPPLYLP